MKGEISLENLILKNTFNDRMNFPFKLKYGQLGKLVITTQSLMYFGTKGIQCKISELFLCFEMLDMQHWSKELVLSKYQELKKHLLKAFEKQLAIVNGEFKNAKEGGDANWGGVEAILANLKIEIDKVYVRFEDEDL